MSATTSMKVGNKGRVVIPAAIRDRYGWAEGTVLVTVERPNGCVEVWSREALLAKFRAQAPEHSVVDELIAERRAEAARDRADGD